MELWSLTLEGEVKVLIIEFATPRTIACQAPLSMGFSRQEYWSGLPCPHPGDLPNPAIEPRSPVLKVDSLLSESPGKSFPLWWLFNCVLSLEYSTSPLGLRLQVCEPSPDVPRHNFYPPSLCPHVIL